MTNFESWKLPRNHPAHLIWRLEFVNEDSLNGWYLFNGEQIKTIVAALKLMPTE